MKGWRVGGRVGREREGQAQPCTYSLSLSLSLCVCVCACLSVCVCRSASKSRVHGWRHRHSMGPKCVCTYGGGWMGGCMLIYTPRGQTSRRSQLSQWRRSIRSPSDSSQNSCPCSTGRGRRPGHSNQATSNQATKQPSNQAIKQSSEQGGVNSHPNPQP